MKLSLAWIQEFVPYSLDRSAEELADLISLRVAEVEGAEQLGKTLQQVRVVSVLATEAHPDADKLRIATIDDGDDQSRRIVCGAPNCRPGIRVPFADLGTVLPTTDREGNPTTFTIKKAKIRGVESSGMLCSADELGVVGGQDGLLELPAEAPLGVPLAELPQYAKASDLLLEIDNKSLTHRPDLWGHYGFARELATIFDLPLAPYPQADLPATSCAYRIQNEVPDLCFRYAGLQIDNITVEPSPEWMQQRLENAGINAINNIVDVTNYVLLELGQPMHAFDAAKLSGTTIGIRRAQAGETFLALNDVPYELSEDDLVIDDAGRAVALAGVMGGAETGVEPGCRSLFLESATFAAASVRRTANRLDLRSESSARFEKSLDPENAVLALRRAAQLILELCPSAVVSGGVIDDFPTPYPAITIETNREFLRQRLGSDAVEDAFIDRILTGLGFSLAGDLSVGVPSWRRTKDISIPEDIVEEVGRHFGYDNIVPESHGFEARVPEHNPARRFERNVKALLTEGYGCTEIMRYPMVGPALLERVGMAADDGLRLTNPVSEFDQQMRRESIPQLLQSLGENAKHHASFRLFEYGRVYDTDAMDGLLPTERTRLVGAIVPRAQKGSLQSETFFAVKGLVDDVLQLAGVTNARVMPLSDIKQSWVHPNIHAGFYRGRQLLASVFKLHPSQGDEFDIPGNPYLFEIHIDQLETLKRKIRYAPFSVHPPVRFEVTVVVPTRTLCGDIGATIERAAKRNLRSLELITVYEGEPIPAGQKAVSYRMEFGQDGSTLSHDASEALQNRVVSALEKAGYPLKQ